MRPSEIIGRTVPATGDPRRWLRTVLRALAALAAAVTLAGLLGAAAR